MRESRMFRPMPAWAMPVSVMIGVLLLCAACESKSADAVVQAAPEGAWPMEERWDFERPSIPDKIPEALETKAFESVRGEWYLDTVDEGRVLFQNAKNASPVFNVLLTESVATDLELEVTLRSVDGEIDQGGGLVWRAKDGENYYIARFNPLEDNYRVYTVVDGVRTQLATADASVPADTWSMLTVRMVGDHITCALDGKPLLDVHDTTFTEAGRIGLWTKADARTQFDDLALRTDAP